jgi:FtsH-binding integral membrane protein
MDPAADPFKRGAAYPPPGQPYVYPPYPPSAYPPPQQAGYGASYPPAPPGYGGGPSSAPAPMYVHKPQRPPVTAAPPRFQDGYDPEAAAAAASASAFAEIRVRSAFVRKVFGIVFLQLCLTVGVAAVFLFVEPVNRYVQPGGGGTWVFWTAWASALALVIALACSPGLRRKHPVNMVALFAFTLVESVLVGVICSWWEVDVVLLAFAVTTGVVLGLTLAALFLPWDFTRCGNALGIISELCFSGVFPFFLVVGKVRQGFY